MNPPPPAHVCICTKTKEESREKVKRKVIPNCINLLVWLPLFKTKKVWLKKDSLLGNIKSFKMNLTVDAFKILTLN